MIFNIAAAATSQPVFLGRGSLVSVTPASGATALVEYSNSGAAAVDGSTATWVSWSRGVASAFTADLLAESVHVRVTARNGVVVLDTDDAPGGAALTRYRASLEKPASWDLSIMRNEALSRFFGCSGSNGLLQTAGQSGTNWCMSIKMEMEAPFTAVRLLRINRSGINSLDGDKALVGVTESNAIDTSYGFTATQNIAAPVVNGVAYPQLAPANTVNGLQPVTWPGHDIASLTNATTTATLTTRRPHGLATGSVVTVVGADLKEYNVVAAAITVTSPYVFTYTMLADPGAAATATGSYTAASVGAARPSYPASGLVTATSVQTCVLSNQVPLASRPTRLDGGARPLLLYRYWHNGTVQTFPFHSMSALVRTPTQAMRGRTIQVGAALADAVGTPSTSFGIDTVLMDVFPVVAYSVPVLSVWAVGDSTYQNDGIVADRVSSWMYRACASLSTPQRPIVYANFGASSQKSSVYLAQAKACLAAGVTPPSLLVVGVDSVNDGVCTDATVQDSYALAQDVIASAKKYGIPRVVMTGRMPLNTMNAAQYALKLAQDAALTALAAAYGVRYVVLKGLGDGANPERWIPALNLSADGFHPTEACIDTILAAQGVEILLSL